MVALYVPAGPVVDSLLDDLGGLLEPGDVIADGGNSYWGDSIRRHDRLRERGIQYVDLGTSGGVDGARHGACFMAGGEPEAIERMESMLRDLAVDGGYVHAGPPGSGHFVKLVHNGIEFGMLQAIGEGMDLLTHYQEELDIPNVLHCWRNGSVIRSWLIDYSMHMEVPVHVIAQSVMQLFASRDERQNWARSVAMMRHGFGGHPFGTDEHIARERREGRIGGFHRKSEM